MIVACLGLFGLVRFMGEQCSKEFGIMKVNGASDSSITILQSVEQ